MADIKDGASCTAAAIESATDNGPWAAGGFATMRCVASEATAYIGVQGPFGIKHKTDTFFRTNPVVANTMFADASVRVLSEDLAPQSLRALVTIAGGDPVPIEF